MKFLLVVVFVAVLTTKAAIAGTPGWILQMAYLNPEDKQIHVVTLGGEDAPKIFSTEAACQAVLALQKKRLDSYPDAPPYVQRCHLIDQEDYQHQSTPLMRRDLKDQA